MTEATDRAITPEESSWSRLTSRLSPVGLSAGAVLFAFSMTPSLVPRAPELQGALAGVVFGTGYLISGTVQTVLAWLGFDFGRSRWVRIALICSVVAMIVGSLWAGAAWQNSIRSTWGLPDLDQYAWFRVIGIAGIVFLILMFLGRLFLVLAGRWSRRTSRFLPERVASAAGLIVATTVFWALIDGVAGRYILRSIDEASRLADLLVPAETDPPVGQQITGGPSSLVAWEDLGRWGRGFVTSSPTAEAIGAFWGEPALQPVRVYVGLTAAGDAEERARLAYDELIRVGGFDREVLVIAMPTGSGWLDPGGMDTLDYITRGDVATVAVQYSYLPSPVSVVVDPSAGLEEAQALFDIIYAHWTTMPPDNRPDLFLHGLSLGAFLSQETVPLLDLFADPINGALWTGSPYLSDFWQMVRSRRHPDSPEWRPSFSNGSLVRAMNQNGAVDHQQAGWGPMRFVLLQYGSDPIVFFDWSLAWSRPDWLSGERAPDVSPQMRWIPVVTFFQAGVDMAVALGNLGYGHDYSARDYIPAWAATLAPDGWSGEDEARLADHLRDLVPR